MVFKPITAAVQINFILGFIPATVKAELNKLVCS